MAEREIGKGDPIVFGGQKYRVRGGGVEMGYLALASAPKRNATHSLHFDSAPAWDEAVGVWRVAVGRLGIHPSRLP